jgi:Flp pilus assembly secretin CpaC
MSIPQKALVIFAIFAAVGVGIGIYEARHATTLRTQIQILQRQQALVSPENRQLHFERHDDARLRAWFFSPATQPSRVATIAGIINDPNFRAVIHALENRSGFEELAEPEAVTTSGREIQGRFLWFDTPAFLVATNQPPSSTGQHPVQ